MKDSRKFEIIAEEISKAVRARLEEIYSPQALTYIDNPINIGVLERPNGFGVVSGLCGDTMKIYLRVVDGQIDEISFDTDGCEATIASGCAVTELAGGKNIEEVLTISPGRLLEYLGGLPADHIHCSILAVNTLMNALANYLLLNAEKTGD